MPLQAERTLDATVAAGGPPASALDRWLLRGVAEALPSSGLQLQLWDGTSAGEGHGGRIRFADRGALWRVAHDPELQFGELFSAGRLQVEGDLIEVLGRIYDAIHRRRRAHRPLVALWRPHGSRSRSVAAARGNASHHYDLGNAFYARWLDRDAMQYTCAYFPEPGLTLEAAQRAKMDHICRKLRLTPGQRVFEAGCGWGGLALHMAREYGVSVRAWNVSREQVAWATERARAAGLGDRVRFVQDDYRNIRGTCDAFVSVGMLEHVGPEHYPALGAVIDRSLTDHGLGLVHSIGRNQPMAMNPWIERHIFPGAHPPAISEMMRIFEPWGFSVLDLENLRLHYARTLRHWLQRYLASADAVRAERGEDFARAWQLYLAGSVAAFERGWMQLFQVVFARRANNAVPATRQHLYA